MKPNLNRFPVNYFVNMCSLKRIFTERRNLNGWKLAFLFLFLSASLMMPLTLRLSALKTVPFTFLAPSVSRAISSDFVTQIQKDAIKGGVLSGTVYEQRHGRNMLSVDPENRWKTIGQKYHQKVQSFKNVIIFQKQKMIISDQNGFGFSVTYPKDQAISLSGSKESLENMVSQLWVRQYKLELITVLSVLCFAGLFFLNFLLMGMMSFIIWLTGRSKLSDIHSFREALSLVILAAGLPSLAACGFSMISFDFGTMIMIQSFGIVLMIALVFLRTHFQNERGLENTNQRLQAVGDENK